MNDIENPEYLAGGHLNATVCRVGDRVRRPAGPWSPAVHALLAHLRQAGLPLAPAPYGIQDSAQGAVEELSFLPGQVPTGGAEPDWLFTDDTVIGVARMVRAVHDATAGWSPPPAARWKTDGAADQCEATGAWVVCHNDLAPWNTTFVDGQPVAFIDWDLAAPGPRVWDIAFAAWHFTPLYETGQWPADPFAPRGQRVRLLADAYGLEPAARVSLPAVVLARMEHTWKVFRDGARAGDPAYRQLWQAGAGDGIRRQIDYVTRNRSAFHDALA